MTNMTLSLSLALPLARSPSRSIFLSFQREIDRMSPQAIVGGWDTSVRGSQYEWRERVTALKLECLFGVGGEYAALRRRHTKLSEAEDTAAWEARQVRFFILVSIFDCIVTT